MADEPNSTLRFPPFHIPVGVDIVYRGSNVVPLEPRAVRLLRYLAEQGDRIVSKEELLDAVWPDVFTTDAVLKTAVAKARRALGDGVDGARWIETHHRRGYRFVGIVANDPAEPPALPPTNLPQAVTRLVGRDDQVASVREALGISRLVTLTGAGGIGKTRLALEAAAAMRAESPAGVWLVELAGVADPSHVPNAVAAALGVREAAGRDPLESLRTWLVEKRALVLLDNCEHLVDACASLVASLLRASVGLRVLATSREALGIAGEAVRPVPPLPESNAIDLFVDRARLRDASFELTDGTARAIAQICRGLDGNPLAIELAAARVRAASVEQIAARLDDRFRLLGAADRSAPSRHRTLRAVMDWSHDLLTDEERGVFRRLSIFRRGFTLEAADAVVRGSDDTDATSNRAGETILATLDDIQRLVDKSLVTAEGHNGDRRYDMLETIRQYAADRLAEGGEEPELRAAHRRYFADLAGRIFAEGHGRLGEARARAVLTEYENFRAALLSGFGSGGDAETAARLAATLGLYWQVRGHWTEGRRWLDLALAAGETISPQARCAALYWAGTLAEQQGDMERAIALLEECLALRREDGDASDIAVTLGVLGHVLQRTGRTEEADACREECLALMRSIGNSLGVAAAANGLGLSALGRGDYARAETWFAEALEAFERQGDAVNASVALHNLGEIALRLGQPERAAELLGRSVARALDAHATRVVAYSKHLLGHAAVDCDRHDEAVALFVEALAIDEEQGDREGIAFVLEGLARAEALVDAARAVRLAGAAEAIREALRTPIPDFERETLARALVPARAALGDVASDRAFDEGRAMTLDGAVAFARGKRAP